jgi:hypothetical protein
MISSGFTGRPQIPFIGFTIFCHLCKCNRYISTVIKKKIKFSSYVRKFRRERLQSHIQYEEGFPNIQYEEMRKYLVIFEEAV